MSTTKVWNIWAYDPERGYHIIETFDMEVSGKDSAEESETTNL